MGMKEKITEILDYLADEETHFWENCTCMDECKGNIRNCDCEQNKNHIWRTREEVKDWLESAYCPLVDEEELESIEEN